VGIAWILMFVVCLVIFWRFHLLVVEHYKSEISRVARERDKWENRCFDEKLKSSNSDFYSMPQDEKGEPVEKDETNEKDETENKQEKDIKKGRSDDSQ
jgi:hypothetical protein